MILAHALARSIIGLASPPDLSNIQTGMYVKHRKVSRQEASRYGLLTFPVHNLSPGRMKNWINSHCSGFRTVLGFC
jgi:hypothetical protein